MAKKKENLYCGKTEEEVRTAFFDGKVKSFCAEILAEGKISVEDISKLGKLFESLRREEDDTMAKLRKEVSGELIKGDAQPPSILQLTKKKTEEDIRIAEEEIKTREKAVLTTKKIITGHAKNALLKIPINREQLMSDAHAIQGLLIWLGDDVPIKSQAYMKRLIGIVDDHGISRREAQDRANLTDEYLLMESAKNIRDIAESFVQNAKKQYGGGNGY